MRQVIYSSRASGPDGEGDLADILERSNRNNPELGITGILIVIEDTYLQFLEGPKENLAALIDFIGTDRRHGEMEMLMERPMARREFGDWGMGYHDVPTRSALDAELREALEAVREGRCDAAFDRLADAVIEAGRAARGPAAPGPGAPTAEARAV